MRSHEIRARVPALVTSALTVLVAFVSAPAVRAQAAAAGQETGARLQVRYSQFTLPNGPTVILHEDHSVPIVSVNMRYHVGSACEKPGRTGFQLPRLYLAWITALDVAADVQIVMKSWSHGVMGS
jgi:hypothetical protein